MIIRFATIGACVWVTLMLPAAVLIGRAMRAASAAIDPQPDPDETWLDDLPVDCLSDAEVRRRFDRLAVTSL